jgi:hypothetical protein
MTIPADMGVGTAVANGGKVAKITGVGAVVGVDEHPTSNQTVMSVGSNTRNMRLCIGNM